MPELHLQRVGDMLETHFGEYHASTLWSNITSLQLTSENVRTYGHDLFDNVTQHAQLRSALLHLPEDERLVLLTEGPEVAAIPWEYMRLPESEGNVLLASRNIFVRGISEANRKAPFVPANPLTIVAVPVSPVDEGRVMNTEGEWRDLARMVRKQGYSLTLTRTRPPTLAAMKRALSRKGTNIVQFMGHSGVLNGQGILLFEDDLGKTKYVDVPLFKNFLDTRTFLVVLNSCQSAMTVSTNNTTSNQYRLMTPLSNIAESLVQRGIPYALGMQFSLPDDAALLITTHFYDSLLQGSSVEEAVRDMRATLEQSDILFHEATVHSDEINKWWLAGLPVLYTNQREAALSLELDSGQPTIQPDIEQLGKTFDLNALPTPAHFVGRGDYISEALKLLLSPSIEGFVVLHGLGGIGKTALARVIAERVSYHFDDHIFAYSFETFTRFDRARKEVVNEQFAATFYSTLVTYYGLDPRQFPDERTLQNAIVTQRRNVRSLLVLDNIETLIEAQKRNDETANQLAAFVSRLKEDKNVVLLTSRATPPADWGRSKEIEVRELDDFNGARLFLTSLADDRRDAARSADCIALTQYVKGHPLSIRLLAGRFSDDSARNLHDFLTNVQNELASARQRTPRGEDPNRHATLSECLEYSIRRLTDEQKKVLYTVGIFLAPFLPEWAEEVLDDKEQTRKHLQDLLRLGLLELHSILQFDDGEFELIEIHPILRQHINANVATLHKDIKQRYGTIYDNLMRGAWITDEGFGFDQQRLTRDLVLQSLPDCEAVVKEETLPYIIRGSLAYHTGLLYRRIGQTQHALALYHQSLTFSKKAMDMRGVALALHAMAELSAQQGDVKKAIQLYTDSLAIKQELRDTSSIAITQSMIARLLVEQGQTQEAKVLFEKSLVEFREHGDKQPFAVTQGELAKLLVHESKLNEAMLLYEESLQILQELGNIREIAIIQGAMGDLLLQQGKLNEALLLYKEALQALQELGDVREAAIVQVSVAHLLEIQGNVNEAIQMYENSIQAMRELESIHQLSLILVSYGCLLWEQEEHVRALEMLWEAFRNLLGSSFLNSLQEIQNWLISLKINFSGDEQQFNILWLQATSVPQPIWLSRIRIGSSKEAYATINEQVQCITEVITALISPRGWNEARRVIEERQEILFRDGIESTFEYLIAQGNITAEPYEVKRVLPLFTILRECKANGIEATFSRIEKEKQISRQHTSLANIPIEEMDEILNVIRAFVYVENPEMAKPIVEKWQTLLFQKKTEEIFEVLIEEAKIREDYQNVEILEICLSVLQECKADGIEETFERIKAMQASGDDTDDSDELSEQQAAVEAFLTSLPFGTELIPRSIAALSGDPQERMAHMQYLTSLTTNTNDEQLKALVNAIQLAMFGGDMAQLGEGLSDVYKVSWNIIVANAGT